MTEYSQKWHNGTSSKTRSTETSDRLAAIQAKLNNLEREIKKVNEKVYAAQFGCELCKGPHYTKDCPLKEEGKTLEEAYYTQFGAPYQLGGQYRAAGPGFYQRNNRNSSLSSETVLFPNRLYGYCCDDWKEAREVKILETYDHTLSQKEKDTGSFTLPCFIYYICFDKALVDLEASVSVMPFSTYSNLGLGDLAHTRLTIELGDRTIKHPRGIAKNVLVRIGKFIFPIDFVILDIPEDDDVPLILGRPFLSTAHAKIDVFKRKITLRVREEKLVFKSIKPATSIIRRVYMVKERTDLGSKTEFVEEAINESFDPLYGNYIELNDLNMPLEPRMNQDDFEPTLEPTYKSCYKMKFSCMIGYRHINVDFLPSLSINIMTKCFYNSIIKDKGDHEGKNLAGTLIDIPIFVRNFSIILGFSITDDMDITSGAILQKVCVMPKDYGEIRSRGQDSACLGLRMMSRLSLKNHMPLQDNLRLGYAATPRFTLFITLGSTKKELCIAFEKLMHEKFQMSSMGELTFFLGLQVKQKKDGIFISQDKYVAEILKKFRFTEVKTASTPMETQKPLLKDEDGKEVDVHMYRSMIGSLMYLTSSRPDIMFAVCACARYQVNPKVSHLHAVKRIFRYLKGQPKLGLWYLKDSPFDLVAYTDSDYAGASLDRKSTTGGCQFLGCRLISWQCKKQTVVANSTTKAEYVAASSCCGQVLWIQNQLLDYGYNFMHTKIFIDNNRKAKKSVRLMMRMLFGMELELMLFWSTVKARTINGEEQLHAVVDGKEIIITKSSVRRDLQLADEEVSKSKDYCME
ncbi:uncharacterized mitochondrial protein-like protein [Tanacetum coccineum]